MAMPYPRAVERFPTLRQSSLSTYSDCALSAGFDLRLALVGKTADGLQWSGWSTHRQAGGQIAHAVIARALRLMVEHGQESIAPAMMMELLDDELRQADRASAADLVPVTPREVRMLRRTLRKWARDNTFTIAQVAAIEERYVATITYPDGAGGRVERVLTGQVDLLLLDEDGHATVVDWKDTWRLPSKSRPDAREEDLFDVDDGEEYDDDSLSAEGYFQQRFYAFLILRNFRGVQSVTLREFYVRRSEPREATIWREELPDLEAEFAALAERWDRSYEEGEWAPSPGHHCSYCPKAAECPIDRDAREGGAFTTADEAARGIREMLKARRVVKQVTRSLMTYCDRNGPVRVRDGHRVRLWGYVLSERVERPTEDAVDRAVRRGQDPRTLFKRKTNTRFQDYAPDADVDLGPDDEDVVAQFEAAAAAAALKRKAGKRRARA